MKKIVACILLLFIISILGVCIGVYIDNDNQLEVTSTNDDTYLSNDDDVFAENVENGFTQIGDFDILLQIIDYQISEFDDQSWVVTETTYGTQGYYFEYPYIAPVRIFATKAEEPKIEYDWIDIWGDSDRLRSYDFIDNFTLVINEGKYSESETLILEEIIKTDDLCSIIKVTRDRFGFENDETDLYYIAFSYENIDKFKTVGVGEKSYNGSVGQVSYIGFEQRLIYF